MLAKSGLSSRVPTGRNPPAFISMSTKPRSPLLKMIILIGSFSWRTVNKSAGRTAMRHRALRPLLTPLLEAKSFRGGRVPKGWRSACGVDRRGRDLASATAD